MKRILILAALLLSAASLNSCGVANGLAQSATRLVQGVGRTVGIGQ
ncbi:MAG: hypothetical protein K9N23_14115 [Akkermansiaceae bacterium]|nr:hypothetical protein [Akkermansiaceae bacterium]